MDTFLPISTHIDVHWAFESWGYNTYFIILHIGTWMTSIIHHVSQYSLWTTLICHLFINISVVTMIVLALFCYRFLVDIFNTNLKYCSSRFFNILLYYIYLSYLEFYIWCTSYVFRITSLRVTLNVATIVVMHLLSEIIEKKFIEAGIEAGIAPIKFFHDSNYHNNGGQLIKHSLKRKRRRWSRYFFLKIRCNNRVEYNLQRNGQTGFKYAHRKK